MKFLPKSNLSFEFFPPKTAAGMERLTKTVKTLSNFSPQFFSVTFGAGGSTRDGTLETVTTLLQKTKTNVAPHISCIGSTHAEIASLLQTYKTLGLNRIVALRGDLPSGMGTSGPFKYACDLVKLIRTTTDDHFHIEVAAYPEIHPQAKSVRDDVLNLKRKYDAGANSAITQYFFNTDGYFYLADECRKQHVDMPIVPGIMPITQFEKLARFSDACGAEIPRWIRKRLESYGDDLASVQQFGIEVVYNLCQNLLAGGAPGLHFYTLNKSEATVEIIKLLDLTFSTNFANETVG